MSAKRVVLVGCALALAASPRQPFTPADWLAWRTAEDPQIAPDGAHVVYVERCQDRPAGAERANLWVAASDGRPPQPLTAAAGRDWMPRWSPEGGRLAYLSARAGRTTLRIRDMAAGTESDLDQLGGEPAAFAWSANGAWLAFTAPIKPAPPAWLPLALTPYWRSPDAGRLGLFVVSTHGGAERRLDLGDLRPLGEPAWTPDGRTLLIAAEANGDTEIYRVPVAPGAILRLTDHPGPDENPLASPDGTHIAWISAEPKPPGAATRKLCVMNADGSRVKALAGALDRDARNPRWSSDSRTLYFLADDHGATRVYAAHHDGSVRTVANRPARLTGFSLADNGRAATVRSSAATPDELVTFPVDVPGEPVTLAAPNQALLGDRELGAVEELSFESAGHTIQGWLLRPPHSTPGQPDPLVADAIDQPGVMRGYEFSLFHRVLAARGWAVLTLNPRGTPGYGEEFAHVLPTRYPNDAFDDIMRSVDAAVARGGIDPKRVALVGGLMAAWALGHTDRFARVVAWGPAAAPDAILFPRAFRTPALVMAPEGDPQASALCLALRERKAACDRVTLGGSDRALEWEAVLAWLADL